MKEWKKVIDEYEKKTQKTNSSILELINYQYGYIAWCLGNGKKEDAENYLNKAIANVEKLEKNKYELSMVYAYKSALWGFKIGIFLYKAPFLGPESLEFAKKSVELDENNYFGYLQLGNIEYYKPSMFGSSKKKALEYYLKAEKLIKNNKENIIKNWNYLSLLITIAQAYSGIENYQHAKKYYEKVLKIEPEFQWVKNELLPDVNYKIKNNE